MLDVENICSEIEAMRSEGRRLDEILAITLDYVRLLSSPMVAEVTQGGRSPGETTP